jgi:hypothetical protein
MFTYSDVSSLIYLHQLSPGNGFQRRSFLSFRVLLLTGRRLSHNQLMLFWLTYEDSLLIAAPACYIASARTAQKTCPNNSSVVASRGYSSDQVENIIPLLLFTALPNNGLCLENHYLATDLHATIFCRFTVIPAAQKIPDIWSWRNFSYRTFLFFTSLDADWDIHVKRRFKGNLHKNLHHR